MVYARREAFDRGAVRALLDAAAVFGRDTSEGRDLIDMANAWEEAVMSDRDEMKSDVRLTSIEGRRPAGTQRPKQSDLDFLCAYLERELRISKSGGSLDGASDDR